MSALRDWQQRFVARVTATDDPLFAVHRNNWRGNLRAALRSSYPVIERLVGAEFFRYCADCYIAARPSRSSNLEHYGADFAAFLRRFEAAATLPYLGDVAALEYLLEWLLVAPDDAAAVTLCSPFPVLAIWRANQPGQCDVASISLDCGGDTLRLYRAGVEVMIEKIAADAQNARAHAQAGIGP